jgi:hypothetical protein
MKGFQLQNIGKFLKEYTAITININRTLALVEPWQDCRKVHQPEKWLIIHARSNGHETKTKTVARIQTSVGLK